MAKWDSSRDFALCTLHPRCIKYIPFLLIESLFSPQTERDATEEAVLLIKVLPLVWEMLPTLCFYFENCQMHNHAARSMKLPIDLKKAAGGKESL